MKERQQNSTTHPMAFLMILSADHTTGAVGVSPVVSLSKDGGTFAACAGAVTENNIAAPTFPGGVFTGASSSGGSLLQTTTYFYKITATNILGETTPGTEQSYTVPTSGTNTNQITINWTAVTGATGYKVYRATTTNLETLLATVSGGGTVSYVDNSATVPSGALPTQNTTGCGWYNLAGNSTDRNTLGGFIIHASAALCDPSDTDYMITGYDPFDAVHFGLTALPNAAAGANGGLPTVDANNSVKLQTGTGANQITLTSGAVSLTVTPPTATQIATSVWTDLTGSDFTTTGSPGKVLVGQLGGAFTTTTSSIFSSAALANGTSADPWATVLPASYTSTQAGAILNKIVLGGVLINPTLQNLVFNNTGQTTPLPANVTQFNGVQANGYDGIALAGTTNTITLDDNDATAAGNVSFRKLTIVGGTGIGQSKIIISVATVSAHRVATVDSLWTINPDNTSQYAYGDTSNAYSLIINSSGGSGDPWATVLPAGYASNQAGFILFNKPTAVQNATAFWTDTTSSDFTVIGSPGKTVVGQLQGAFINASASVFSTPALVNAPGSTGPTAAAIATAVWTDVTGSDFTTTGSPGKTVVGQLQGAFTTTTSSIFSAPSLVNAPGGSGADPWLTNIATGGYTGNQAGAVLNVLPRDNNNCILASSGLDGVNVETNVNARQGIQLAVDALMSILSGVPATGQPGTILIKSLNGSTTRITIQVDGNGNRTGITVSPN